MEYFVQPFYYWWLGGLEVLHRPEDLSQRQCVIHFLKPLNAASCLVSWVELVANDSEVATGYWDSEATQDLNIRDGPIPSTPRYCYGVTRRARCIGASEHYAQLENIIGTIHLVWYQRSGNSYTTNFQKPTVTSVVVYGVYKAPLANESPEYVWIDASFVLTTGTPDWTSLAAKKQFGPIAIRKWFGAYTVSLVWRSMLLKPILISSWCASSPEHRQPIWVSISSWSIELGWNSNLGQKGLTHVDQPRMVLSQRKRRVCKSSDGIY